MEEDYKYIMFQKLYEMGGETIEDNDNLKLAAKTHLNLELQDDDPLPTFSPEDKLKRKA